MKKNRLILLEGFLLFEINRRNLPMFLRYISWPLCVSGNYCENKDELGNRSLLDITNSSEHQVLDDLLILLLTILIPALILCCAIPSISPFFLMAAVLGTIVTECMFFLYCLFSCAVLGREKTTGPRQYLDAIYDAQLAIARAERHPTPAILSAAEINLKTNVIFYP